MRKKTQDILNKDKLEIEKMRLPLFKKMTKEEHICYEWGFAEGKSRGSSTSNLIWIILIIVTMIICMTPLT